MGEPADDQAGVVAGEAFDQRTGDAEPPAATAADSLAMLAAALVNLSAADRAKLAAMLLAGNDASEA